MANLQPKVSVFIPVYNRAHLVRRAINSVLAQSYCDFELLIIDDGSTDATADVVESYDDKRIRLLRNDGNKGIPVTRQRGLTEARGTYLALLDSDDWMCPHRLAKQVAFLDRHPDIACVGGSVQKYHPDGRPAGRLVRPRRPDEVKVWLLFRNGVANTTLMGRTDILRRYGYRPDYFVSEDFDLAARLAARHHVANLPEVMTYMLEHDGRTTNQHVKGSCTTKTAIMAAQLGRLGMPWDDGDLARHYCLSRLKQDDLARFPDYLDWARLWLAGLSEANRRTEIYDPQALRGVLGVIWAQCCLKAHKRDGYRRTFGRLVGNRPDMTTARILGDQLNARLRPTDRSARLPLQYH